MSEPCVCAHLEDMIDIVSLEDTCHWSPVYKKRGMIYYGPTLPFFLPQQQTQLTQMSQQKEKFKPSHLSFHQHTFNLIIPSIHRCRIGLSTMEICAHLMRLVWYLSLTKGYEHIIGHTNMPAELDRDSDTSSDNGRRGGGGLLSDTLAPGVITRLQFASYLFVGLAVCLILKGSAGHAFESFSLLRRGCEFIQTEASNLPDALTQLEDAVKNHATTGTFVDAPTPSPITPSNLLSLACFENTLVYRVSFSLAIFFLLHLVSVSDLTCCIPAKARAQLQERFFSFKTLLLILLLTLTFSVVPNHFFSGYAWLCMGVSAVFLVIQVILLVDFSYQWNDEWSSRAENNTKWQWYLLIVSGGCYLEGLVMVVLSFVYFVPHSDCNFNAFAITAVAIVPGVISTLVAVWVPHGSIVPSGIVFAYCATMEFITLRGAQDAYCNTFPGANDPTSVKALLLSSCFSGLVLAYSVVSSGGSRTALSLEDDADAVQDDADTDGHLAGYMYFHGIMMMGSMYMAMLVSDWQVSGGLDGTGATATVVTQGVTTAFWVKHGSIWLTMSAYLWTLLAPYYCCKDRDFGMNTDDW